MRAEDPRVARVMAETGMAAMQAINHVRQREALRRQLAGDRRECAR